MQLAKLGIWANAGHIILFQHPHEHAVKDAGLVPFEFYCWRHTFGTRAAQSGMDRFSLARLMGHSSPSVTARYYIHVTESHVAARFGKFVEYQTRNVAGGLAEAVPAGERGRAVGFSQNCGTSCGTACWHLAVSS